MHNRYLVSKLGVTTVDNLSRVFFVLLCCECRLLDFPTVTQVNTYLKIWHFPESIVKCVRKDDICPLSCLLNMFGL